MHSHRIPFLRCASTHWHLYLLKRKPMAEYDYRKGKERIEDILDNELKVIEQNEVPTDSAFTFSNGYYSWVSAIFVDMRDSSTLFAGEDKEKVSKNNTQLYIRNNRNTAK